MNNFRSAYTLIKKYKTINKLLRKLFSFLPVEIKTKFLNKAKISITDFERKNKIIFIHIPKTGGMAIYKSLFNATHSGHYQLIDYELAYPTEYNNYLKLCVVRNPWDRFVSAFHYLMQGAGGGPYGQEFCNKNLKGIGAFNDFLVKFDKNKNFRKKIMSWQHFMPQVDFIKSREGAVNIDLIGRFENLDEFAKEICGILDLEFKGLEKINYSRRNDYRTYYKGHTKKIIEKYYKEDIEQFNYKF